MDKLVINASKRDMTRKQVKRLRVESIVPATMYGPTTEPMNIQLDASQVKVLQKNKHYSGTVNLIIDGKDNECLVKEVAIDVMSGNAQSVSFMKVDPAKKVTVGIRIVVTGISPAVKSNLGFLVTPIDRVFVNALPKDIPSNITIDISNLVNIGQSIILKDVVLPEGVNYVPGTDIYVSLATIVPPQKEIRTETTTVADGATEGTNTAADSTTTKTEAK